MKQKYTIFLLLFFATIGIHAQNDVIPEGAEITKMGHLTMTVKKEVRVDSVNAKADTVMTVQNIEWDTPIFTAKKRIAQRRRKSAMGNSIWDKDTNWWWDMWWFQFSYMSIDSKGDPIRLSGLVCMPDGDCDRINNVVIGCHATITANRECPSMNSHNGLFDTNDTDFFMLHASSGNITHLPQESMANYNLVIIPDYEGYGVSKDRPHPYLSEEITARQVVDGVLAGISLYKSAHLIDDVRHPFRSDWRSFCLGYSQGGGTAMAVHRFIEQNHLVGDLHFTGSFCGAGPYDPMATFQFYMQQCENNKQLAMTIVMPLILKGMCDSNPYMRNHKVSDYLTKSFLDTGIIGWIDSKEYSHSDIKGKWNDLCKKDDYKGIKIIDGKSFLNEIMLPEGYDYFLDLKDVKNPDKPSKRGVWEDLHRALDYNNLTKGWNPEHPLILYHSWGDDAVPITNRSNAKDAFGEWVECKDPSIGLNHVATAIEFLGGTEKFLAVNKLATSDVYNELKNLGSVEPVYENTIAINGTRTTFEFVIRDGGAILGSGYNACISQYCSGEMILPTEVMVNNISYPVTGINDMAFRLCTGITKLVIPEGVTRVGDFACYGCKNLIEIDLPSTLQTIGTGAFIDLPGLATMYVRAETPPRWEYNDVFRFHKDGIGDTQTYTLENVAFWVADGCDDSYKQSFFSDASLEEPVGWVTPEGWGTFSDNIREIRDFNSEPYAAYADSTLTFYYDGRRSSRTERTFDLNVNDIYPGWTDDSDGTYPTSSADPEDHSKEIKRVVFMPCFRFARPVSMAKWFEGCENLDTIVGWENLVTSEVTTTAFMFSDCKKLTDDDLDFSHFDTSKCENFIYMFENCSGLIKMDMNYFDVSNALALIGMFQNCTGLTEVNLDSLKAYKCTDFTGMFFNCSNLKSIAMEKLGIRPGARVASFFNGCSSLETLTLPFAISDADYMFHGLTNLKDVYYYGVEPFVTWGDRHKTFLPDKQTRFHVLPSVLSAWEERYPTEGSGYGVYANVTYVGDCLTEENPMLLYNSSNWEWLNYLNEAGITDTYVKMMDDFKVETMLGSEEHPYVGTFDGNGHTLTIEINHNEDISAPFRYINGATIQNLVVDGLIGGLSDVTNFTAHRQVAGLVGWAGGNNYLFNNMVKPTINAFYVGDSSDGGIIAHISNGTTTIKGCIFKGIISCLYWTEDTYLAMGCTCIGGFVGWVGDQAKLELINSAFAPEELGLAMLDGCQSFARTHISDHVTYNQCYCTTTINESQGKQCYTVSTDSEGVTIDVLTSGTEGATATSYDVSGLTFYNSGTEWCGLKIDSVIYGGYMDKIPLSVEVPNGYIYYDLSANKVNNLEIEDYGATVTMDNAKCIVSANVKEDVFHLYADRDNSADLERIKGSTFNIQLDGRTFRRDGTWNTLSLPFDLSAEQLAYSELNGCSLVELKEATLTHGTLCFTFADTTAIDANKVYLVRWTEAGRAISSPTFNKVTVSRVLSPGFKQRFDDNNNELYYDPSLIFRGTYNQRTLDEENVVYLVLGNDNKLYVANKGDVINATEASFELFDVPFGFSLLGDVNCDEKVTIADVTSLVNIILGKNTDASGITDLNEDGSITISDITTLVNIILGKIPSERGFNAVDTGNTGITLGSTTSTLSTTSKKKTVLPKVEHTSKKDVVRLLETVGGQKAVLQ